MADYSPPLENLPIFDSSVFKTGDTTITQSQADKRYLRYPNAQGTENLQAINVSGVATFNSTATFNQNATFNSGSDIIQVSGSDILQQPSSQNSSFPNTGNAFNRSFFSSNTTPSNNPIVQVTTGTNNMIMVPTANAGGYNPLVQANDAIFGIQNGNMSITRGSTTTIGLRIQSTNSQIQMGAGGTTSTPSNAITIQGSTNLTTLSGTTLTIANTAVNFTSSTPPTSSATQPSASDSSTIIPTTAWVQTAITAGGGGGGSSNITPNSITITPTSNALQYTSGINSIYNMGAFYALSGSTTQLYTNTTSPDQYTPTRPIQIVFTTADGSNSFNMTQPITFDLNCFFYDGSSYGETSCQLMLFPSALTSNWGSYGATNYNINNNILGNTGFYSTGRQYWTSNQQLSGFSGSQGWLQGSNTATGVYTIYIYFTMWTASTWTYWIKANAVNGATGASPQMGIKIFS